MINTTRITLATVALLSGIAVASCGTNDADVASENISQAADNFKIERQVVLLNVRTGKYELEIIGLCNLKDQGGQVEVTCKVGDDDFVKHFFGIGPDLRYFAFQRRPATVSVDHYRTSVKPESIIPDFEKR